MFFLLVCRFLYCAVVPSHLFSHLFFFRCKEMAVFRECGLSLVSSICFCLFVIHSVCTFFFISIRVLHFWLGFWEVRLNFYLHCKTALLSKRSSCYDDVCKDCWPEFSADDKLIIYYLFFPRKKKLMSKSIF